MRSKDDTFVRHFAASIEAENLKASTIGQNRFVPLHERMQTTEVAQNVFSGPQIEMVRVAQNNLSAHFVQFPGGYRFHCTDRSHGHERRSFHDPVGQSEASPPCKSAATKLSKGFHRFCHLVEEDGTKINVAPPDASKITLFPAVNAAILNPKGQLLLTLRSNKVREPGLWCLPGGHFDPGETWAQAAAREVKEEVGLTVWDGKLLGIYSDPALNIVQHPNAPGGWGQFLAAVFVFRSFEGDVTPNEEVAEWGWFSADALPEPFVTSHRVRLGDLWSFQGEAFSR